MINLYTRVNIRGSYNYEGNTKYDMKHTILLLQNWY